MTYSGLLVQKPSGDPPGEVSDLLHYYRVEQQERFCHILEHAYEHLRTDNPRSGFPWITPVLGSGCRDAQVVGDQEAEALAAAVKAAIDEAGAEVAGFAAHFTMRLLDDRRAIRGSPGETEGPSVDRMTTLLVALTAIVTRFYHEVHAATALPLRRHSRGTARVLRSDFGWLIEILAPVKEFLAELEAGLTGNDGPQRTLKALLARIKSTLVDDQIHAGITQTELEALTEFTWYHLSKAISREAPVYPGWSDLMLSLSMHDHENKKALVPLFDSLSAPLKHLKEAYKPTVEQSVERRFESKSEGDYPLISSIASVLVAQWRFRKSEKTGTPPPIPAAFVTTFDVELESAILKEGISCSVAVPAFAIATVENKDTVLPVWLKMTLHHTQAVEKDAKEKVQYLLDGSDATRWTLLSTRPQDLHDPARLDDKEAEPIVVHLAGHPLLEMPDLGPIDGVGGHWVWPDVATSILALFRDEDEIKAAIESEDRDASLRLVPAVLINEFSAMHQSGIEMMFSEQAEGSGLRYGLPIGLTSTTTPDTHGRYWLLAGLQIHDPAVRQRVTAQLTIPYLNPGFGKNHKVLKRNGVAINSRITDIDHDLLAWYALDVVQDDVKALIPHLEHYVRHLNNPDDRPARIPRSECQIE